MEMEFETKKYVVHETNYWLVNLANNDQTYLGRCYVTLKRPCGDLADLTPDELTDFLAVVKTLERATAKAFGATMHNWGCLMNNAYRETEPKPQVHWHFRPRYRNAVQFAGENFTDTAFGNHYLREPRRPVSEEVASQIISALKQNL
jgi:diadenosine tetraphosphate (Ap4A) HIT family hydrolase